MISTYIHNDFTQYVTLHSQSIGAMLTPNKQGDNKFSCLSISHIKYQWNHNVKQ